MATTANRPQTLITTATASRLGSASSSSGATQNIIRASATQNQTSELNAIVDYMKRAPVRTEEARKERSAFLAWYSAIPSAQMSAPATATSARRKQLIFDRVNAPKPITANFTNTATPTGPMGGKGTNMATPLTSLEIASLGISASQPTIRQGSTGPAVATWQRIIGVTADGKFGPQTHASTMAWQRSNGLTADGIVGPQTWMKALSSVVGMTPSNTVMPVVTPGTKPTLREGMKGEAVKEWQVVIGAEPDGIFGPVTKTATIAWQRARGLTADGIVGPATWARAQSETASAMITPAVNLATAAAQAAVGVISAQASPPASASAAAQAASSAQSAGWPQMPGPGPDEPAKAPAPKVIELPPEIINALPPQLRGLPDWALVGGGVATAGVGFFGLKAIIKRLFR